MPIGKLLIISGLFLVVMGLIFTLGPKLPWPFGRLPGDIFIQRERFTFAFPIVTCLVLSLLLTLILNLFFRR
jgi:hypothetical protein